MRDDRGRPSREATLVGRDRRGGILARQRPREVAVGRSHRDSAHTTLGGGDEQASHG